MKILVLDEELPHPLNTGKRIRTFNLISRLAKNHDVRYLAYGSGSSPTIQEFNSHNIRPIIVERQIPRKSGPAFYARLAANLLSKQPYIVSSHYSDQFGEALDRALRDQQPDVVIAEWTPYAIFLDRVHNAAKVIVAHNIETDIWKRYHQTESNMFKRLYIGLQARKMERFEQIAFRNADGATAVSIGDAEAIRSFNPRIDLKVVENGVDLDYFTATEFREIRPVRLVFTGSMDWRPNQDAAIYFVREIYPILQNKYPDIRVVFVGRNPPPHIARLTEVAGISVTGTVDDVRPYIREATVYIVPLRVGGGSRLKILEAFALGKPVVSTSVGAEGLEVKNQENILLGDSPEEFVAQIVRLVDDSELAAHLARAGRRLVEQQYGWDYLAGKLEKYLINLTGS